MFANDWNMLHDFGPDIYPVSDLEKSELDFGPSD